MTSPSDTTLHERHEQAPRTGQRLVAVCVASKPVLDGRAIEIAPNGRPTIELGRAVSSDPLGLAADPFVSRRHAIIERQDGGALKITRTGSGPLQVNTSVLDEAVLADGDVVLVGESAIVVREGVAAGRRDATAAKSDAGIVGGSPAMVAVRRAVGKVARTPVTVLLLGESGTGKEVVARALHQASGRKGEFVAVNCAAIPESLAEAQLFGHVAGAFTGAQKASPGLFRAADGGTLFLDELGDLPRELQPKLLRALEERAVSPLGATAAIPVDVRVVTATHRDLLDAVRAGTFRGDLYARVAEFVLQLPPLRARPEDVLPLLSHLYGGPLPPLRFDLLRALLLHRWPFNVRELRTVASQLKIAAADTEGPLGLSAIDARMLTPTPGRDPDQTPRSPFGASPPSVPAPVAPPPSSSPAEPADRRPPARAELEALLREHRGNVTDLARAKGRSRKQVYRWLEAHDLDPTRYRSG